MAKRASAGWVEPAMPLALLDILAGSVGVLTFLLILSLMFLSRQMEMNYLPLEVVTRELPSAQVGEPYEVMLKSRGGDQPQEWAISSDALPSGLQFSADLGAISGIPESAAAGKSYALRVAVREACGHPEHNQVAQRTLDLHVKPRAIDPRALTPLRILTSSLPVARVGEDYALSMSASGGLPPYAWTASQLPDGFTLDEEGLLTGSRATMSAGDHTVRFEVRDARRGTATRDLTLRIIAPPPALPREYRRPRIKTETLPDAEVGKLYAMALSVVGGMPPYRWQMRWEDGATDGIGLEAGGLLTGIASTAGPRKLRVWVRDSQAPEGTATAEFDLQVLPVQAQLQPLRVVSAALPAARMGEQYASALEAVGGQPPYEWRFKGLPRGVRGEPEGKVAGSMERAGDYRFEAQVEDSSSPPLTDKRKVSVAVIGPEPPPEIPRPLLLVLAALAFVLLLGMWLLDVLLASTREKLRVKHAVRIIIEPDGSGKVEGPGAAGFISDHQRAIRNRWIYRIVFFAAWVACTGYIVVRMVE